MNELRATRAILVGLVLCAGSACAETGGTDSSPLALENEVEKSWSFGASIYGYFVPDSPDYAEQTITADHHWLHLEARYNYEDLETGSVWLGYNFSGGEKLAWELTPMLGGVFGHTTGIAPGYKG